MDCLPRNAGFLLQFQVSLQRFDIFLKSLFPLFCHPAGGTGLLPYKLLVYLNVSGTAQFLQLYTYITRSSLSLFLQIIEVNLINRQKNGHNRQSEL